MKLYKFAVYNWKSDYARAFWFYKHFPSEYLADRYAMRVSFARNSPYIVAFCAGEEVSE
jgi:hypothetical protein